MDPDKDEYLIQYTDEENLDAQVVWQAYTARAALNEFMEHHMKKLLAVEVYRSTKNGFDLSIPLIYEELIYEELDGGLNGAR